MYGRDERSNHAVVQGVAVGEGNEEDVFLTGPLDLSGTDHAPGIGQQNDLEQDLGMDGGCAGLVVVAARIKDRQVKMLLHQFADRVLQRTWDKLVLQGDREHYQLIFVEWFEFCHRFLCLIEPCSLVLDSPCFFDSFNGLRYWRWGGR